MRVPEQMVLYASPVDTSLRRADWLFGSKGRLGQFETADLTLRRTELLQHLPDIQIIDARRAASGGSTRTTARPPKGRPGERLAAAAGRACDAFGGGGGRALHLRSTPVTVFSQRSMKHDTSWQTKRKKKLFALTGACPTIR